MSNLNKALDQLLSEYASNNLWQGFCDLHGEGGVECRAMIHYRDDENVPGVLFKAGITYIYDGPKVTYDRENHKPADNEAIIENRLYHRYKRNLLAYPLLKEGIIKYFNGE